MLSEAQRERLRSIRLRAADEATEWRAGAAAGGVPGVAADDCAYRALRADCTIEVCDSLLRAPENDYAR